jgi:membrane associated rhomboid family serine protease
MLGAIPPVTRALLAANIAVYLAQGFAGESLVIWFALWPFGSPAFTGPETPAGFLPWQLVTYSFLHGSLLHLGFNMLAVWMFGGELERVWGPRRLATAYFASVITGAVMQLMVGAMFGEGGPVIGASAGVFGLLLAYALVFPNRRIMPLFPPIPMPARVFVLLYAVLELIFGVTGTVSGVAHFAHLGGLIGGLLVYKYWRSRPGGWRRF